MVLPSITNWFLNSSWRQRRRYRVFLRIASSYALSLQKRLHTSSTRQIWLLYLSKKNIYLLPRKTLYFGQNQSKYQISRYQMLFHMFDCLMTIANVVLYCCSPPALPSSASTLKLTSCHSCKEQFAERADTENETKSDFSFFVVICHIIIWRKPAGWFYFLLLFYSHSHCHPAHPTPPSSPTYKSIAHPPPTLY